MFGGLLTQVLALAAHILPLLACILLIKLKFYLVRTSQTLHRSHRCPSLCIGRCERLIKIRFSYLSCKRSIPLNSAGFFLELTADLLCWKRIWTKIVVRLIFFFSDNTTLFVSVPAFLCPSMSTIQTNKFS